MGVLRNSNWSLSHLHLVSPAWRQIFHLPSFFSFFLEGIFRGIFQLHQGFCWAVNHKWHLPSHPRSVTQVQVVILLTGFKLLPEDFWTSLSTAAPLWTRPSPSPPRMPDCDCTRGEHCTPFGFSIDFSHMPFLCIFFLPDRSRIYFHLLPPTVLWSLSTECFTTSSPFHRRLLHPLDKPILGMQLVSKRGHFFFASFFCSQEKKKKALYIPYIDSSHIKTS